MPSKSLISPRLFASLLFILTPQCVLALESAVQLYSKTELTNNVQKVTTNTESEALQVLGLTFGFKEDRKLLRADANFKIEKEHYFDKAYSDQTTLTAGVGLLNLGFIESFLNWNSSFSRTETLNDPLASDTPDNRTFRNIFRTGPSIFYKISPAANVRLSTSYVNVENSDEDVSDNERLESSLSYSYRYNSYTKFDLSSSLEDIIDGDEGEEFRKFKHSVGLTRGFSKGSFTLALGLTALDQELSEDEETNFFDLTFIRSEVFLHDIELSYLQDVTDTTIGFESDVVEQDGAVILRGVSVSDVVERRRFQFKVAGLQDSLKYDFSGFWESESYNIRLDDQRSRGVSWNVTHYLTKSVDIGFRYNYELSNFLDNPAFKKEKLSAYNLNVGAIVSRQLNLSTYLQYEIRQNNKDHLREYEEWSFGVNLKWLLL